MGIEKTRHHEKLKRAWLVLAIAAVAAALLTVAPGADAATYCVGSPAGCSGTNLPGNGAALQQAFDLAAANAEGDAVRVGAGTYAAPPGGFKVSSPAHPIQVSGASTATTILQGSGPGAATLAFTGNGGDTSTVKNLGLRLSADGGTPIGLVLASGAAASLAVTAPAGLTSGVGIRVVSHGSVEAAIVKTPGLVGVEAAGNVSVSRASITAGVGVRADSGTLAVGHSRVEADRMGIVSSVPAWILSTLIHVEGGANGSGVIGSGNIEANHLTVVGTGGPKYGVRAFKQGGGAASLNLTNSTVNGFEHDLSASTDALSLANLSASYSNYSTTLAQAGGVIEPGAGNVDGAPGFVDAAAGDFHLRHDSALVDTGHVLPSNEDFEGDLDELLRVVDGDATDGARRDVGAYEYQRAAPVAEIGGPAAGVAGEPIDLSGAGSRDPDPGDDLTYAWWFGDGAKAAGPLVSHAFAAPGTYPVTLQVTDPTGQQTTTTKEIVVHAPAGRGDGADTGVTPDTLAPVIGRLRIVRAGKAIRFRLSEPARVTIRLTRARAPRLSRSVRVVGRRGANLLRLRGRLLRGRTLRPGRYRIRVSALDTAGNRATPRAVRLVLRRRAG